MSDDSDSKRGPLCSRRSFVQGAAAGLAGLTIAPPLWAKSKPNGLAGDFGELDASKPGGIDLYLERKDLLIGGKVGRPITINGSIPGPTIRMKEGKDVLIRVHNRLGESTSIHWHGMLVPFNMDGVPGISFPGIDPGETFTYKFDVRQNGTYWYHSHTGLQEQLGHYGQLIVEPKGKDPVDYDVEHTIVLSDWIFEDPNTAMKKLKTMEGYYNFQRPTLANLDDQVEATDKSLMEVVGKRLNWDWMRMDPTDIADITGYAYSYLLNGRTAKENPTFAAQPGQKVRFRITNASTMTYYDFRIPGLPMTVVNADGQNVEPVETDELRIAVAETYDVVVTLPDQKAYTIFAETMDRSGFARGTLAPREGMSAKIPQRRRRPMLTMADMGMLHGSMKGAKEAMGGEMEMAKPAKYHAHDEANVSPIKTRAELAVKDLPTMVEHGPDEHGPGSITMAKNAYRQYDEPGIGLGDDNRRVLSYGQLKVLDTPGDRRPPTREINLHLTGNMHKYIWGFNGKKWSESQMIRFKYGERLRINMINDTMMNHPIHLHGMWMDLYVGHDYGKNPRKHTVNVQPAELLTVDITADAPGQWAFHCHLLYHMKAGMFRTVAVVRDLEGEPIDAEA
jgi:CopA family copper-resistance protein